MCLLGKATCEKYNGGMGESVGGKNECNIGFNNEDNEHKTLE